MRCCSWGLASLVWWCGHVICMDDTHIPKQKFYWQLLHVSWRQGRQYKWYKDCLKDTVKQCDITPSQLEMLASDRTDWWSMCKSAVQDFEAQRVHELEAKHDLWKSWPPSSSNFQCQICQWMCCSHIGLLAYSKSHSWWWDLSRRRLRPSVGPVRQISRSVCHAAVICRNGWMDRGRVWGEDCSTRNIVLSRWQSSVWRGHAVL